MTVPGPFGHLQRWAAKTPDAVCFDAGALSMTYGAAHREATRAASLLRHLGVRSGETVALSLPIPLHLVFTLAVFHEGAISAALPSSVGTSGRVANWLLTTDPKAAGSTRADRTVLIDAALLGQARAADGIRPVGYPNEQSVCRLVYSSGTTGHPKAVAFTVEMSEIRARAAGRFWMHTPPFMSLLDVGTVSGWQAFYASLIHGTPYLAPGAADHNVAQLRRHRVASIKASPNQVAALADEVLRTGVRLPDLRIIQFAGASLPPAVARRARAAIGAKIFNLYGSTETGTVAHRYTDSDDPFDLGTVAEGAQVQIVDEHDQPLPAGSTGAIRYRREHQADGYVGDPEASRRAFKDGWFHPGDLGSLSADGHLRLAGRSSEIVNAGGVKINPAQVDMVARDHPGVLDAAAFGHVDASGLTRFVLAVVAGPDLDTTALIDTLTREFGTARPQIIAKVTEIPHNAMGKPLRRELAERFRARDL